MKKLLSLCFTFLLLFACSACSEDDSSASILQNEKSSETSLQTYEVSTEYVANFIEENKPLLLIDVREDTELEETGVIQGARNIPLSKFSDVSFLRSSLARNVEAIVYCRSGNRSRSAYARLHSLGFYRVKSMQGGIRKWIAEGRKLVEWEE
jgi:rhodanese-related sulfurtransferase